MSDIVDTEKRSRMMSGIRAKNTRPELIIRSGLHKRGFRYRLHISSLPGKPDMVLKKHNAIILVNGCFWHGHNCHLFKWPKTRPDFWKAKIEGNRIHDQKNIANLRELGWRVLIVWECALKGRARFDTVLLFDQITEWLKGETLFLELSGSDS